MPIGANVYDRTGDEWTALCVAAGSGYIDVVKVLLAARAPIYEDVNRGWTALYAATEDGHTDALAALLEMLAAQMHGNKADVAREWI